MRRASHRTILFAILAAALVLRVGMAFGVQYALDHVLHRQFLIEGDAAGYWELGQHIAAGEPYAIYDPPRHVLRMPGVPVLLAGGIKLADAMGLHEHQFVVCRVLLAMVGAAGCGFVYLLAASLFNATVGLWAAAITAIAPAALGFSPLILSETPFAVTLTLNLWCMARLWEKGRGWKDGLLWSTAVGLSGALACYMRPSWLLAIPLFGICVVFSTGDRRLGIACAAVVVASLLIGLLPWAVRNHAVTGRWVFTTLWVGPSLYDGLNPAATGDSEMSFFDRDRLGERMSEREVDQEYRRRAWAFARENPGRVVQLGFVKLGRYWNPLPNAQQFSQWWLRWPLAIFFVAATGLAIYGGIAARASLPAWALCAGPLFYFAAIHAVFVGSIRYRLPAEYPAYALSAAGIVQLLSRRGGTRLPEAAGATQA